MKLTRKVCIGFRNVGAASHQPEFYEGTLADSIKWMIQKCAEHTIAKRFSIAIARNIDECRVQFEQTTRGAQLDTSFADVMALLDSQDLLGFDDDESQPSASGEVPVEPANPLDNWKGKS